MNPINSRMTELPALQLDESDLVWETLREFIQHPRRVELDKPIYDQLVRTRLYVEAEIRRNIAIYGVNTGFGRLASIQIPGDQLEELQENLILSHAAGVGKPVRKDIVRLMLLIKIQSLTRGYSGIRPEVVDGLRFLLNEDQIPVVPEQGSVGASGDLAPLSHMTLPLLGQGEIWSGEGSRKSSEMLSEYGRQPLKLQAKEGLAIINGTQSMTAHGLYALMVAERLLFSSELIVAATVDAMKASINPFFEGVHRVKKSPFNQAVASRIRTYLRDSRILESHKHCGKVQDPYSIRCVPQVIGAIWEAFAHVKEILVREANAVSDNPLIFPEEGKIVSGGNFHGESIALTLDYLSMAMAELGSISERRTANLVDKNMSDLPAFLVENGGINSGYMIAHVTAAALVSENKGLAVPSSVDSIPTSANQEDHVSMGHRSAVKLLAVCENVSVILAIELLAALQGIEFRHPDQSSQTVEKIYSHVRKSVPYWDRDRQMNHDIEKVKRMLISGEFLQYAQTEGEEGIG